MIATPKSRLHMSIFMMLFGGGGVSVLGLILFGATWATVIVAFLLYAIYYAIFHVVPEMYRRSVALQLGAQTNRTDGDCSPKLLARATYLWPDHRVS